MNWKGFGRKMTWYSKGNIPVIAYRYKENHAKFHAA
jgi:hypothetical protein